MKILYEDLKGLFDHDPTKEELSEKLFQLGHEHEVHDDIFEMELTPNRGDCFSLLGLARDLNVFFKTNLDFDIYNEPINSLDIDFENLASDDCPKISFLELEIEGEVKSYKCYLENYFKKLGINRTNFFTDISNYLSYEQGQPTHCFDRDKITGKIKLENKECDTRFKTLLNTEVNLKENNLVFEVDDVIISLAGVMGGFSTSCSKDTKKVLVECAFFKPESIIGKSIKYNLVSDAAHKFERGVDILSQERVIRRFVQIVSDHAKIKNLKFKTFDLMMHENLELEMDVNTINSILGTQLEKKDYEDYLKRLGFSVTDKIIVPSYRHDIRSQNDLAEEIARSIGYNNILSSSFSIKSQAERSIKSQEDILKNYIISKGFAEVINFPFTSTNSSKSILVDNPLDSNKNFMRLNLQESLIENLLFNERRQKDSVKLFEISEIYSKHSSIVDSLHVGIIASGRQGENYQDFTKLIDRKYFQDIFEDFDINIHEIPRESLNTKLKSKIFYTEFNFGEINKDFFTKNDLSYEFPGFIQYQKVSEYPSIVRDISFLISDLTKVEDILEYFKKINDENLKKSFIFDFYKNEKLDHIKIGYRFIFQSKTNTLTDSEINKTLKEMIKPVLEIDGVDIPGM